MTGGEPSRQARRRRLTAPGTATSRARTLELVPGKRIVQSWRTSNSPTRPQFDDHRRTRRRRRPATRLTLTHSGVPDGQTSYENGGWQDNYFTPMKAYFASQGQGKRGRRTSVGFRAGAENRACKGRGLAQNIVHFARALRESRRAARTGRSARRARRGRGGGHRRSGGLLHDAACGLRQEARAQPAVRSRRSRSSGSARVSSKS